MSSIARVLTGVLTGRDYINHLFDETTDGYIQVMKLVNGKPQTVKNYKHKTIMQAIDIYRLQENVYITPNTTFNGRRATTNIRQLRSLYIDIDNTEYSFTQIVYEVWDLANLEKIPYPTMIVSSGRGLHVYWRIENAPYQAVATWQELEDFLYYQLKYLGADKKATDSARILRLPDTKNNKNNEMCKVILVNDVSYSMYDLREKYLKWKPKVIKQLEIEQVINKKKIKTKVLQFFTSYTLHLARTEDILKICELRNYRVTGDRNMILHCYAYWLGVTNRNKDELKEAVNQLNDRFTQPMKQSEVNAILRCIPKAIDKFIAYEQGLRSGEVKRVSKGMRDKGGYWYKNQTLIERLNITTEEQKHLKTIIDAKEKYRRCGEEKKAKQKASRRDKQGLTQRERDKQELIKKIGKLKLQGETQKEVAQKLDKGIATIKRYWNV